MPTVLNWKETRLERKNNIIFVLQINAKLDCTLYSGISVHFVRNIHKIGKEINLIQEYRTSIIAEAVMGKINILEYKLKK